MKKIVLVDETNDELELQVYVNADRRLYIETGVLNEPHYKGYVTLDVDDALTLRQMIDDAISEMTKENESALDVAMRTAQEGI